MSERNNDQQPQKTSQQNSKQTKNTKDPNQQSK